MDDRQSCLSLPFSAMRWHTLSVAIKMQMFCGRNVADASSGTNWCKIMSFRTFAPICTCAGATKWNRTAGRLSTQRLIKSFRLLHFEYGIPKLNSIALSPCEPQNAHAQNIIVMFNFRFIGCGNLRSIRSERTRVFFVFDRIVYVVSVMCRNPLTIKNCAGVCVCLCIYVTL